MINLPDFTPLKTTQVAGHTTRKTLDSLDHALIIIPKNPPELLFKHLPQGQQIKRILQKKSRAGEEIAHLRINNAKATTITISFNTAGTTYNQLCWARNLIAACNHENPSNLGLLVLGLNELDRIKVVSALTAAAEAEAFKLPVFKTKTKTKTRLKHLRILSSESRISLDSIQAQSLGNNIARWFTALPPNILDARKYFDLIDELCGQYSIEHSILNESTLKKLGANAFLAVSQGNAARDAGIIKLKYRPNGEEPADLMLIGKGILFDTGGNNLKPFKSMLDMHMDMGGSAVALGTLIALASLKVPYSIDAWLAVTENRISATAYKSQDIIKSANGTTIQVIHTDAEGRMVLADTLALAARENPKIIIDYATLTGTCVSALTERYSGIFSNRTKANKILYLAGVKSGERVWPFPMDEDFDELIKSNVADIKQCSEIGYGDHILAARFLSKFVPNEIPWIHLDMSAGQHKGGLAHIPSEITGFGVKLTLELLSESNPTELVEKLR